MPEYKYDVAVSAVSYDSLLVDDLMKRLQPRVDGPVVWSAKEADPENQAALSLLGADSRAVLIVLHRLWSHEPATAADSGILRQRMRKRPKSVVVLALEGASIPSWLKTAHVHDLRSEGIDPLIETLLAAVAAQGGVVRAAVAPPVVVPQPTRAYSSEQPPFLAQPRAQNALRKELGRLFGAIESRFDADTEREEGDTVELSSSPNRFIARQGAAAISFSWLAGRLAGVTDGRLLVIEWDGVAPRDRGMATLKSAKPCRETTYQAEGAGPDSWCWRDGDANGRACSTVDLVGEWLDSVGLTPRAPAPVPLA